MMAWAMKTTTVAKEEMKILTSMLASVWALAEEWV
jgi:hypothetical protein